MALFRSIDTYVSIDTLFFFYRVSPHFNALHPVLPRFIEFYRVISSFIEFYRVLAHFNALHKKRNRFLWKMSYSSRSILTLFFYRVLPSFTEFYRVLPSFTTLTTLARLGFLSEFLNEKCYGHFQYDVRDQPKEAFLLTEIWSENPKQISRILLRQQGRKRNPFLYFKLKKKEERNNSPFLPIKNLCTANMFLMPLATRTQEITVRR